MSRILALHGYLQTGSVLSSRLGHLRKANPFKRAGCQFFFIDGPYLVVRDDDGEPHGHILAGGDDARDDDAGGDDAGGDDAGRSWWRFSGGPSPTTGPSQSYKYDGIEASVRLIERAVVEHEIDTILGFSQGAAMAAYFCATQDVSRLGVKRMLAYAGFFTEGSEAREADAGPCADFIGRGQNPLGGRDWGCDHHGREVTRGGGDF